MLVLCPHSLFPQNFIQCWLFPFQPHISFWYAKTSRSDKCKYARTLVPSPLAKTLSHFFQQSTIFTALKCYKCYRRLFLGSTTTHTPDVFHEFLTQTIGATSSRLLAHPTHLAQSSNIHSLAQSSNIHRTPPPLQNGLQPSQNAKDNTIKVSQTQASTPIASATSHAESHASTHHATPQAPASPPTPSQPKWAKNTNSRKQNLSRVLSTQQPTSSWLPTYPHPSTSFMRILTFARFDIMPLTRILNKGTPCLRLCSPPPNNNNNFCSFAWAG